MNRKHTTWLIFILFLSVNQIVTGQNCNVDGGVISPSGNTVICSGDDSDNIINVNLTNNIGSNSLWILTDQNNIIMSTGTSAQFNFEGFGEGVVIIYHVSHDGTVSFPDGTDLDNLTGCYDLSNPISIIINTISGGIIYDDENTTVRSVCVDDGVLSSILLTLEDNIGDNSRWLITDETGIILDIPPAPPFSFEGEAPGLSIIYNISFDEISGLEVGANILDLSGCYDLSNPYQVIKTDGEVDGGNISTNSLQQFCSGDGVADIYTVNLSGRIGDNSAFIVANAAGEILMIQSIPQFDFEGLLESQITVWHLSYNDGLRNLNVGRFFSDLQGCFNFSNSLDVDLEVVDGGTINNINGPNDLIFCTDDGISDMVAIEVIGSIGAINRFVLTNENGDIIDITSNTAFNFEGVESGKCFIYNISYNSVPRGLDIGDNIEDISDCHSLSNAISVTRLAGTVNSLTISTSDNTTICTGDDLPDIIDVQLSGSAGSTGAWIITDEDSIILDLPAAPPFDFSTASPGLCRLFYIDYAEGTSGIEIGNKVNNLIGCFELSNDIEIDKNGVNGGQLTLASGDTSILICVGNSSPNILPLTFTGGFGSNSRWVVTEGEDSIILVSTTNQIDFNITQPGSCKLWHISFEDGLIGLKLNEKLDGLIGCFDLSNPINIAKNQGNTFPGTIFTNDPTDVCVGEGSGDNIEFDELPGIGTISNWIVTDSGGNIIVVQLSRTVFVDDLPGGTCTVRNIRYEEGIMGLEVGGILTDLQGCFSLSNPINIVKKEVSGGTLTLSSDGSTETILCKEGTSNSSVELNIEGEKGDDFRFLLTTVIGNILEISSTPIFQFEDLTNGDFGIWHIGYEQGTTGIEVGGNINQIVGCFDLSNPVSISIQTVNGGNIQTVDGQTSLDICVGEGTTDLVEVLLEDVIGLNRNWILTDGVGEIIKLPTGPVFNFEDSESGVRNIYNISYNGELSNLEIGMRISDITGCFDLSNPLFVSLARVTSGSLSIAGNGMTAEICSNDGTSDIITFEVTGNEGPATQLFTIDEEGDIMEIFTGSEIDFTGEPDGNILVSSITYYNLDGFQIGANVQDIRGCFDISNTVTIIVNRPNGGNLTNEFGEREMEICVGEGITDFINIQVSNVTGSQGRWFITDESGIILENNRTPPFNLENAGNGTSKIYHVRYEGELTGTAKGLNISTLQGCLSLSNALTVIRKNVNAGEISYMDGTLEKTICLDDDYLFDIELAAMGNEGQSSEWAITDTTGIILATQPSPVFNFDNAGEGSCLVYLVSYNDNIAGLEAGKSIDSLEGCFLVSNSVRINRVIGEACTTSIIDHNGQPYSVNIYPNPALSEIYIHSDIPGNEIEEVGIFDLQGKKIKTLSPTLLNIPVSIDDFQSGIYLVRFSVQGKIYTFRFIKN